MTASERASRVYHELRAAGWNDAAIGFIATKLLAYAGRKTMSDNLMKQLRDDTMTRDKFFKIADQLCHEAADRIEELESLVEYAFREGVRAGMARLPDPRKWENSAAYAALNGGDDE